MLIMTGLILADERGTSFNVYDRITSLLPGKAFICELLPINHNRLAMQENKSDPAPLVRGVSPKMIGTSLDARITCLQNSLVTRIKFKLYLAKDDDTIVQSLGTVHWAASTRWDIDETDHRTIFVVRFA